MVRLREYRKSRAIAPVQPWILLETTYVSPDGRFTAGIGYKPQLGCNLYGPEQPRTGRLQYRYTTWGRMWPPAHSQGPHSSR
jgi:hypothetical protein